LGQVNDAEVERARQIGLDEGRRRLTEAVNSGDQQGAAAAAEFIAQNGPRNDPRLDAWVARNPWFRQDEAARQLAIAAGSLAKARGASLEGELEAAEEEVRRKFPWYFPKPASNGTDNTPPKMAAPTRMAGAVTPREKGWSDIPFEGREAMRYHVNRYRRRGISEAEAQKALASTYWKEQARA
jgi:hypothetical protein